MRYLMKHQYCGIHGYFVSRPGICRPGISIGRERPNRSDGADGICLLYTSGSIKRSQLHLAAHSLDLFLKVGFQAKKIALFNVTGKSRKNVGIVMFKLPKLEIAPLQIFCIAGKGLKRAGCLLYTSRLLVFSSSS